jgi:chromosome transmission fidelity protein 1
MVVNTQLEDDKRKVRPAKRSCGCPMLRSRSLLKEFSSEVSNQGALDIEDLAQIGKKIGTCPYYGSRDMVRSADLVVLPYQSLLLKSARESLGLNLKNSVVIIDEAHNLADSLSNMYNSKITSSQVTRTFH